MSAAQRPARRSARLAFDEEELPPAKKHKPESSTNGATKPAKARKPAAQTNKAKADYDEDADGFQFSRTKPKANASKPAKPPQPPAKDEQNAPAPARRKRASKEAVKEDESRQPRRRSARLSGEKVEQGADTAPAQQPQRETETVDRGRREARTPTLDSIRVEKKRSPTKIALPFADTPVIQRNKEMRKTSGEGRRRSSSTLRGRRASSLIDSGSSNAMPHSAVNTADFYKHIHQDLMEPRRMKQLLLWCGSRALPDKPSGNSEDDINRRIARQVMDEVLEDFKSRSELSDWFSREEAAPTKLIKAPNPRNLQNAAKALELEREIQRLEQEEASWTQVVSSTKKSLEMQSSELRAQSSRAVEAGSINASLLGDIEQADILSALTSRSAIDSQVRTRVKQMIEPLEFKIDSFAHGVHKLDKTREQLAETTNELLKAAAEELEAKDAKAKEASGASRAGVFDILRSISRAKG